MATVTKVSETDGAAGDTVAVARGRLTSVPGGKPDLDASLTEIAVKATALNLPVRMRLQPNLLMYDGNYVAWAGVSWVLEVADADAAKEFRRALDGFIRGWVEGK